MGYKIQYGLNGCSKKIISHKKLKKMPILRMLFSITTIILLALLFHYRDSVLNWLLPGDYPTTVAAFKDLILHLRSGESAGDAITVFCKEILENAAK